MEEPESLYLGNLLKLEFVPSPVIVDRLLLEAQSISFLAKIFSELAQDCARLYNRNKTKSRKCNKPYPNFDKFDFMVLEKLLQVYTSWQK